MIQTRLNTNILRFSAVHYTENTPTINSDGTTVQILVTDKDYDQFSLLAGKEGYLTLQAAPDNSSLQVFRDKTRHLFATIPEHRKLLAQLIERLPEQNDNKLLNFKLLKANALADPKTFFSELKANLKEALENTA